MTSFSIYDNEEDKDINNSLRDNLNELEIKEEENKKNEEKRLEEEIKNKWIRCEQCHYFPEIRFYNNFKFKIKCKCGDSDYMDYFHFKKNYIINKIDKEIRNICNTHSLKFEFFCPDCKYDICQDCVSASDIHRVHSFKSYKIENNQIAEIKKVINNFENKPEDKKDDNDKNLIEIFKIIIRYPDDYKNLISFIDYPCQYFVNTIDHIIQFLPDFENKGNQDKSSIENEDKIAYSLRAKFEKDFNQNQKITSIDINEQSFSNLKIFENKNFKYLEELELEENNITDIHSLMEAEGFDNLKKLSLARNKINDENILKYIDTFHTKFPKLEHLSLYYNILTDYTIFKEITKIKNLKELHMGSNKFIKNKIDEDLDFTNITFLDVSCGVFSSKTINYVSHFKFKNLKQIYLKGNHLNSLSFLEKMNDCGELEILWLNKNNIDEFHSINNNDKFINLKDINLGENKISDISGLKDFIKKQKNLNFLYLNDNLIDLFKIENINIIKEIKKDCCSNLSLII